MQYWDRPFRLRPDLCSTTYRTYTVRLLLREPSPHGHLSWNSRVEIAKTKWIKAPCWDDSIPAHLNWYKYYHYESILDLDKWEVQTRKCMLLASKVCIFLLPGLNTQVKFTKELRYKSTICNAGHIVKELACMHSEMTGTLFASIDLLHPSQRLSINEKTRNTLSR